MNNEVIAEAGPWKYYTAIVSLLLLMLIGIYWETSVSTAATWWRSRTYSHGMLIVPVSLYLIWARRQLIYQIVPSQQYKGLLFLIIPVLLWLLSYSGNVLFLQQLTLVTMIPVIVYITLGKKVLAVIAFPLAYLFFAVPIGESLVPPLQDVTAFFTVSFLKISGIPVNWEGRFISVPNGNYVVAETCSGIRYLIASIALGSLYAYLTYSSYRKRAIFMLMSVIVPIIANGIRAYGIIILAIGRDHLIQGWIFFGIVTLLLFWIGSFWRDKKDKIEQNPGGNEESVKYEMKGPLFAALCCLLTVSMGPLAVAWSLQVNAEVSAHIKKIQLIPSKNRTTGQFPESEWQPKFIGANQIYKSTFRKDNKQVFVYIALYLNETQDAELVNSEHTLYDKKKWRRLAQSKQEINLKNKASHISVNEVVLRGRKAERIVWSWYRVYAMDTKSEIVAKVLGAWKKLTAPNQTSAAIVIAADISADSNETRADMSDFISDMHSSISLAIDNAGYIRDEVN